MDEKLKTAYLEVKTSGMVSADEFVRAFESVINLVVKSEKTLLDKINRILGDSATSLEEKFDKITGELKKESSKTLADVKSIAVQSKRELAAALESIQEKVNARLAELKDGEDGKDADEEAMMAALEQKIPSADDIALQLPKYGERIRDSLELLQGDERLDKSAIKGLEELEKKIDTVAATPGRSGGGVSAMGVRQAFKLIAHTEAPVGDIDGANTTYRVKHDIFYVFGFTLNGEQIAQLPNFTYSGKTITFSTAIPAAYSGKDWEIKYIG